MNPLGFSRNFMYKGKNLIIRSKNQSKNEMKTKFKKMNWEIHNYYEFIVDESIKPYFEKENSYQILKGRKVLYSYFLKKI